MLHFKRSLEFYECDVLIPFFPQSLETFIYFSDYSTKPEESIKNIASGNSDFAFVSLTIQSSSSFFFLQKTTKVRKNNKNIKEVNSSHKLV